MGVRTLFIALIRLNTKNDAATLHSTEYGVCTYMRPGGVTLYGCSQRNITRLSLIEANMRPVMRVASCNGGAV